MTDEEVEMTEDILPACSSYCEHCSYAMCGDFLCDITDDATIVDWKPFPCHHPERRKLVDDSANEDE